MKACFAVGLAVVPQGGLTGLCGGARPLAGCVVLSLERMVGVEEIDGASSTMTVLAGTPLDGFMAKTAWVAPSRRRQVAA